MESVTVRATGTTDAGIALDRGASALILGVAAMMWFGWSQASPPAGWSLPLSILAVAGMVTGVLTAAAAVIRSRRYRDGVRSMTDPAVHKRYLMVVATEALACLAGAAGLSAAGRPAYTSAWILLVVGIHFLPLARLFRIVALTWAGAAAVAVALAAAATGAVTANMAPSTVAGIGGGLVCLCCGLSCLRQMTKAGLMTRAF